MAAARFHSITVYILDDQILVRAGVRSLLGELGGFEVVGGGGDAREALAELAELRPDVVLLDIAMPGLSGLDAIPLIRRASPESKIVMLTHHEGASFVEQCLRAGAEGYLSKSSDPVELSLALRAVHAGNPFVSPRVAAALVQRTRSDAAPADRTGLASLTPRERQVFQLLALGRTNKEVAGRLGMSLGTAKKHRENLQRKLGCQSAAELARLAIREGLLSS